MIILIIFVPGQIHKNMLGTLKLNIQIEVIFIYLKYVSTAKFLLQ